MKVARHYVASSGPLIYRNGEWLAYDESHWALASNDDIRCALYESLEDAVFLNDDQEQLGWKPNKRKVNDVMDALPAVARPEIDAIEGGWFRQPEGGWLDDNGDQVIPCRNGLLRLKDPKLLSHTPDHFNRYVINCDYNHVTLSEDWNEVYIPATFDNDRETIETAEEYGGYVISGDSSQHKFLDIYGPTRSGKGTYVDVVSSYLPEYAKVGLIIDQFLHDNRFGLGNLVGKSLISISDQRDKLNDKRITELVNNIVGCDPVMARSPYGRYFNGTLPGRIIISDNEMTTIPDDSGSIAARTLVIRTPNSFEGKEDTELRPRLCQPGNLSGILNRFLDGLDRLNDRGYFRQPASAKFVADEMKSQSSPIRQFLKAACMYDPAGTEPKINVYRDFLLFSAERGFSKITEPEFAKGLYSVSQDKIGQSRPRIDGHRVQMYTGMRLLPRI